MQKSLIASAVLMLSISAIAAAEDQKYGQGFSINPGVGYYSFDSELDLEDDSFPSIGLEYRLTRRLAAEISYFQATTQNTRTTIIPAEYDVEHYRLNGNYYFRPEQKFQPFATIGIGSLSFDQEEKNIHTSSTVADLGAGLRYFFTPKISLKGDLRAIHNIDDDYVDALANISVNFLFGVHTPANDEDIGAPVNTAPQDSDGDGINDKDDDCADTEKGLMVDENGCAIPVEQTVSMDLNVNFKFDSSKLPPEFYSDVKELATFLKTYKDSNVTIEGHADATGPEEYNDKLSKQRAQAIQDILVKDFSIDSKRIEHIGYGESRPIADNATAEGRSKNRRAATVVTATRTSGGQSAKTKPESGSVSTEASPQPKSQK